MRPVIYSLSISLDGFIEGPGHDISWNKVDDELHTFFNETIAERLSTHVIGRRTYELMAAYWPEAAQRPGSGIEQDYGRYWVDVEKVVFSTTLDRVDWNSRLVRGDVAGELARLRAEPGRGIGVGGPTLARSFIELDLVDEYHVYVHPVIIGAGTPMFPPLSAWLDVRLVWSRTFGSGVVGMHYVREREAR